MKGLRLFMTDIERCNGKDEELKRINKELANIRSKFKGDKPLNGYQKKKYLCKLVFIFLLGHKVEFGLVEAVNLLSSNAYYEKQAAYLFISVVKGEDYNFMPLVINALKFDLSSSKDVFQNLALQFIANSVQEKMVDFLFNPVIEVLFSSRAKDFVKQSAVLALLQLLRIKPDLVLEEFQINHIINLISHHNASLATTSASLIEFLARKSPSHCESCVSQCIIRLSEIIKCACIDLKDYIYYILPKPFLVMKLLRILQHFPAPTDATLKNILERDLSIILTRTCDFKTDYNAKYAVVFESIALIFHMELGDFLNHRCFHILGNTLEHNSVNTKFMALQMMIQLSKNRMHLEYVKSQFNFILNLLKLESNISIKKLALDLLSSICSIQNVKLIVDEMLHFLECEYEYREDIISQTAALVEQFGNDREWYFDTIVNLIEICGDKMSDNVWHSLLKIIIQNDSIQEYAAEKSYAVLCERNCQDILIKISGYILGEFGYLIRNDPRITYRRQFGVLKEKYNKCSPSTKALLLTTFMKFYATYPDLKDEVQFMFKVNVRSENEEIQQRAVEYLKLSQTASRNLLATVFEVMPESIYKESAIIIEKIKFQNFSVQLKDNRPKTKSLPRYYSQCNLKSDVENSNELKILMRKSASYDNFRHFSYDSQNFLIGRDTPSSNVFQNTLPGACTFASRIPNVTRNKSFLYSMLYSEKGTLFENDTIAVIIESEFRKQFGKFQLKYINLTESEFSQFSILDNFANIENKCSIYFKPINSKLLAKETMEQDIHTECLNEFSERPSLNLKFVSNKQHHEIKLILPLTLNKFVEPSQMTLEVFTKRWEIFEFFGQESVKLFMSKYPMIHGEIRQKLEGFRLFVIESMESECENFHCSGIFYSRDFRLDFLIRLERNITRNKYCCRVRSSRLSLSHIMSDLLLQLL